MTTLLPLLSLVITLSTAWASGTLPSLKDKDLAHGPRSSMHMLLEKTLLRIDVLTVDVRFGPKVAKELAKVASSKPYSEAVQGKIAKIAIGADNALVQLKFKRSVPLGRWMGVVRENLEQAEDAGLITAAMRNKISAGLPKWFAPLEDRGYEEGDRVLYRVRGNELRTVVVTPQGKVLVDRTDTDPGVAGVVMATYFAPGSEFREPLINSL